MSLPRAPSALLERIAPRLTLQSRQIGARVAWRPYPEQLQLFSLLDTHSALLCAKPRKTGISTASELADVIETCLADAEGNRIRTVIVIDTDDKTYEHQAQINDFAAQLELDCSPKEQWITFPNGSEIVCMTAGGKQPGRGGTIHRLHCTEIPFWRAPRDTYQALRSACIDTPRLLIETTLDPTDAFVGDMWRGVDERGVAVLPEYHRHFWRVEDHASYKLARATHPSDAPPGVDAYLDGTGKVVVLTAAQWAWAQDEGFTRKASAAWWIHEALANKCAGDVIRLMHDYPQHERHLLQVGGSRVVKATPRVSEPLRFLEIPSVTSGSDPLVARIYAEPHQTSRQCIIGVDTSRGIGKSRHVVVVVDKKSAAICAAWSSSIHRDDDIAAVIHALQHLYEGRDHRGFPMRPLALVEDDGIGQSVIWRCQRLGIAHEPFHQGPQKGHPSGRTEQCITASKNAVEAGIVGGPAELAEDCAELRKENGVYVGRKDMIMALGMCLVRRVEDGYNTQPDEKRERDFVSFKEDLRQHLMGARAGKIGRGGYRPPWG